MCSLRHRAGKQQVSWDALVFTAPGRPDFRVPETCQRKNAKSPRTKLDCELILLTYNSKKDIHKIIYLIILFLYSENILCLIYKVDFELYFNGKFSE